MKEHKRQSRPSEYEAEFYTQCHGTEEDNSVDISLPPLSSSHLPYHALVCGNARKIISECAAGAGKEGGRKGRKGRELVVGGIVVSCQLAAGQSG